MTSRDGIGRGFLALPHEMRAEGRRVLEAMQWILTIEMAAEANWESGTVQVDGVAVVVEAGEVLLSTRGFADRYGVKRNAVRRLLRRLERMGWIERRKAGPPPGPPPDPRSGPPPGPPPTVVRFRKWREIMWPPCEAGPLPGPHAGPPPDPLPGPIQHKNTEHVTQNTETTLPSATPPAKRRGRRGGTEPDPRHRPLQQRLEAAFLDARGTSYGFNGRDAKAITELLRLSGGDVGEVERRWRIGLAEAGFHRCDTLHELANAKWNTYAGKAGATPATRTSTAAAMPPEAFTGRSGGFGT